MEVSKSPLSPALGWEFMMGEAENRFDPLELGAGESDEENVNSDSEVETTLARPEGELLGVASFCDVEGVSGTGSWDGGWPDGDGRDSWVLSIRGGFASGGEG